MIKLHFLEYLPIGMYLVLLLFIGFRRRGNPEDEVDFLVGGRQLTLPAFVATLVTTWYGGILGVGEFTYRYGISNWVVFGLPYYLFAIVFAFFLAPRVRKSNLLSIPDQFYRHYGKTNGLLGTLFTFLLTLPAPYVLMVGLMVQMITGWSLWICVMLGTLFSLVYVVAGGFRSVVRTDKLQFLLMFGGFSVILVILVSRFGGLGFLKTHLPALHLTWHGGNSPQYLLVWFFIALLTIIDPGFHQRCYAAKTGRIARNGILWSVGFWFLFDFLTTTTGLYARALLNDINPVLSFPLLSHQVLPPLLSGIFLTGLLATIMSTLDSNFLLSAITIGHDFFARVKKEVRSRAALTRLGLGISAALSVSLALALLSVIQLWYVVGTFCIPPMLLLVMGSYFSVFRLSHRLVRVNLTVPFLVSLIFLIQSVRTSPSLTELTYWLGIQPMYPGLFVSLLIWVVGWKKSKKEASKNSTTR